MARETIAGWKQTAQGWKDKARSRERDVRWYRNAAAGLALTSLAAIIAVFYRPMTVQVEMPKMSTTVDKHPAPVGMKVIGEPPQATFEPTTEWKKAQTEGKVSPQRVLASVRVGRNGGCSATIIRIVGESAWGISAAHCASRVGDQFTIGNPDGSEASARWIAIDRKLDLSLFITWSKDVLGSAKVCADCTPDFTQQIEAIGYPGGSGPNWKKFKYRRTEGHGEAGNRKYFRDRYLFSVEHGHFAGGDSGGGVFYDGDYFIGVMTHGGPHAASLPQIQSFLAANKSKFKGETPFAGDS